MSAGRDDATLLSPTLAGRMEAACDRFEADWRAGLRPRIEDRWATADGPEMLRELLVLELLYRLRQGDPPHPVEYDARFPSHGDAVRDAFEAVPAARPRPADPVAPPRRADAERNLLFGVLAMQMNFVSRESLIAAVSAWVLDKSRPLDRVLVEQGALAEDERDLLEPLIRKHLQRHGDDPGRSLVATHPLGAIGVELGRVADPDLQATLVRLGNSATSDATRLSAPRGPTSPGRRFQILRPVARGGLGEVFVARDEDLSREVALKTMRVQFADDPQIRRRFLLEAEFTGRLEHPGIIPVYGMGFD
jgi:hypothetical protein